jgi:hypothetical protein
MPANETEFDNVTEEIEQRIRSAVDDFKRKCNTENWKVEVHGLVEAPNFKVSITASDDREVRLLVANTLDAGKHIFDALETEHEKWQVRTTPLPSA